MLNTGPIFLTPKRLRPELPLFVFLPGMDGTGQLFRTQTDGLEAGFDVRCLAIPPTDLTGWDELAAQTVDLIHQELQKVPNRPVYLCGESFGGCLAIKVALHSPYLFKRVILANPASSFKQRPFLNWSAGITSWMPEAIYRLSSLWLMPFLARLERLTPDDRQALLKAVQSVPQKTSIWRLTLLNEFTISEAELQKITQPVLLIAGAADQLLPSLTEVQRLQQTLPNSKVVVLPDSGHACLLEADLNLYEIMQKHDFLEALAVEIPVVNR